MKSFITTLEASELEGFEKVIVDDDLEYDTDESLYVVTSSYIKNNLNEELAIVFHEDENDREIRFRASRQIYNYIQFHKTWPGEWEKKKYLLNTIEENVDVLKRIIRSHIESHLVSERMKVALETGIDLDAAKVIEGFTKDLEENQLAITTKQIFDEIIFFSYKDRVDQDITDLGGI